MILVSLVEPLDRSGEEFVVNRFHPLGVQRTGVLNLLFADFAPTRIDSGVILVARPTVDQVAWADDVQQFLWIGWVIGILAGVQMIKVAEGLVEAVNRWKELVPVT